MELLLKTSYRGRTLLVFKHHVTFVGSYYLGYIEMQDSDDVLLEENSKEEHTTKYDIINANLDEYSRAMSNKGIPKEATLYDRLDLDDTGDKLWLGFDTLGDIAYKEPEDVVKLLQSITDLILGYIGNPELGNNKAMKLVFARIENTILRGLCLRRNYIIDKILDLIEIDVLKGNPIFSKEYVVDRDGKSYLLNCFTSDIGVDVTLKAEHSNLGNSVYKFTFNIIPTTQDTDVKFIELEVSFLVQHEENLEDNKVFIINQVTSVVPKTKNIHIVLSKDKK